MSAKQRQQPQQRPVQQRQQPQQLQHQQQRQHQQQPSRLAFESRIAAAAMLSGNQHTFTEATRTRVLASNLGDIPPPNVSTNCPDCGFGMSEQDVKEGFTNNNLDFSTQCPDCFHRFITTGTLRAFGERANFPALCADQTKDAVNFFFETNGAFLRPNMTDFEKVDALSRLLPNLAWNAFWHGSSRRFFRKTTFATPATVADAIQYFLFGSTQAKVVEKVEKVQKLVVDDSDVHLYGEEEEQEEREKQKRKEKFTLKTIGKEDRNKISKAAVKRIANNTGVKRIAPTGASRIQDATAAFVQGLIADSTLVMEHRKAKTLQARDTDLVMQIRRNLTGRGY